MNQLEYETLCKKAEALAEGDGSRYRRKLYVFSLLGHLVLFGLLVALIGIVVGLGFVGFYWSGLFLILVKKKVLFLILPVIWIIARALWVKFDKPTGRELTRNEFPVLFDVIDELEAELKTPSIHQVLLTDELNASIVQTPRLGVFGWQHNTLTLGLTLLLTLSPEQARSVIAHELGHLSGSHSAFAGRIYRSRIAWGRVMDAMGENNTFGGQLVHRFFSWYAPRFSAYSFALARQNEYEADTIAANLTSPEDAGGALAAVHTHGSRIDSNYWQSLYRTADHISEPHAEPWRKLKDYLAVEKKCDNSADLQLAMSYTSDYSDTHPSLAQRLENLNVSPVNLEVAELSAADKWFEGSVDDVLKSFDQDWMEANIDGWKGRYEYVQAAKRRIKEFESIPSVNLNNDEMREKVALWGEFKADEDYIGVVNESVSQFPEDLIFRFLRGRVLANTGDDACLVDLTFALQEREVGIEACFIAYHYLVDDDRIEEAESWREKSEMLQQELQALHKQRNTLNKKDKMRKAQISDEQRAELQSILKESNLVKRVWIAEKQTPEGVPASIALVVTHKKLAILSEAKFTEKVVACIPDFDGWVFLKDGEHRDIAKKVYKLKDRLL